MILHARHCCEGLEANRTLEWLLFAVLVTMVSSMVFAWSQVWTHRAEVHLGPCHMVLPTPNVALNMEHCLQIIWERGGGKLILLYNAHTLARVFPLLVLSLASVQY